MAFGMHRAAPVWRSAAERVARRLLPLEHDGARLFGTCANAGDRTLLAEVFFSSRSSGYAHVLEIG